MGIVALENANALAIVDTATNTVTRTIATGQAPQGMVYVPGAVPSGDGMANLLPPGDAALAGHLAMGPIGSGETPTTATVHNQGLVDIVQAAVTGLEPKSKFILALASRADASGPLEPLASFMSNPAGAAIVDAVGPLRSMLVAPTTAARRWLVVATDDGGKPGRPIQVSR